jgi:hypothetical protein
MNLTLGTYSKVVNPTQHLSTQQKYTWTFTYDLSGYKPIEISATTGESVGFIRMCPYDFYENSNIETQALRFDGSPPVSWIFKPYGIPQTVFSILNLDYRIGNCASCGGGLVNIKPILMVCLTSFGSSINCSYVNSTTGFNIMATKNSYPGFFNRPSLGVTHDLSLPFVATGYELKYAGLLIENLGSDWVGFQEITIEDVLGIEHCTMASSCDPGSTENKCSFRLQPNKPFFFPCSTPFYSIDILPSNPWDVVTGIISSVVSALSADVPKNC